MTDRLREAVRTALDWRGLDGDGISDPARQQLIDALADLDVCEWHRDEDGMWHTGCGHTHWHLSPALPTGVCPFECCGRKIEIKENHS